MSLLKAANCVLYDDHYSTVAILYPEKLLEGAIEGSLYQNTH